MAMLDEAIRACANETWDDIVPILHDYIAIPNVSPAFDPDWRANGHMAEAVDLIAGWCRAQPIDGPHARRRRARRPHPGDPDGDPGDRGGHRTTTPCCSTGTSTSSRRWRAGARGSARGRRCSRAIDCTAGAAPTTATPPSPASPRSVRCTPPAARMPGALCSSSRARSRDRPTCRSTSRPWPTASARRAS